VSRIKLENVGSVKLLSGTIWIAPLYIAEYYTSKKEALMRMEQHYVYWLDKHPRQSSGVRMTQELLRQTRLEIQEIEPKHIDTGTGAP